MAELLPIGVIVRVTERGLVGGRTYVGRVVGYDMGRTKYNIGLRYMPGRFAAGGWWAFLGEVEQIDEDATA